MKRKLWILCALLVLPLMVWAATTEYTTESLLRLGSATSTTVDEQHTAYGSWTRACSTGAAAAWFEPLDSGRVLTTVSGVVTLYQGQKLYVGIDSTAGTTDTIYGFTVIKMPDGFSGTMSLPFEYSIVTLVDSLAQDGGTDSLPNMVATFATKSSTDQHIVTDVVIKSMVMSDGGGG